MIRRRRSTRRAATAAAAMVCGCLALTACSGMRTAPPVSVAPPLQMPAPIIVVTPPSLPPMTQVIAPPIPSCIPEETKPKSTRRARPRPEHKEAPPQLPTAPTVEATPAGGTVNAVERSMSAPVMSILGKQVKGPKGEDLGRVVDVLADASGRVRIAIIDFGGFLGVGDRRIAVDWPLLRFNPDGGDPSLLLSVGLDRLQAAPEYKGSVHPETLMEPEASGTSPAANNR